MSELMLDYTDDRGQRSIFSAPDIRALQVERDRPYDDDYAARYPFRLAVYVQEFRIVMEYKTEETANQAADEIKEMMHVAWSN